MTSLTEATMKNSFLTLGFVIVLTILINHDCQGFPTNHHHKSKIDNHRQKRNSSFDQEIEQLKQGIKNLNSTELSEIQDYISKTIIQLLQKYPDFNQVRINHFLK